MLSVDDGGCLRTGVHAQCATRENCSTVHSGGTDKSVATHLPREAHRRHGTFPKARTEKETHVRETHRGDASRSQQEAIVSEWDVGV